MRDWYAENPYEKTPLDYSWAYVRQYCAEIDEAARNRMELIVRSLAEQNGVTEQLKAENQMEWVRQMNACKAQAEEIVKAELIYDWVRKSGQKTVRTFLIQSKMTVELFTILWYNLNTKIEKQIGIYKEEYWWNYFYVRTFQV